MDGLLDSGVLQNSLYDEINKIRLDKLNPLKTPQFIDTTFPPRLSRLSKGRRIGKHFVFLETPTPLKGLNIFINAAHLLLSILKQVRFLFNIGSHHRWFYYNVVGILMLTVIFNSDNSSNVAMYNMSSVIIKKHLKQITAHWTILNTPYVAPPSNTAPPLYIFERITNILKNLFS